MGSYKTVETWQMAMELADAVYDAAKLLPKEELFQLSAQLRSSALSIPSNIAEGKGRGTDRDYRSFVIRARGSMFELETQIEFARRRKFFDDKIADSLLAQSAQLGRKIGALIRYLDGCLKPSA